jgi:hypothetical protein
MMDSLKEFIMITQDLVVEVHIYKGDKISTQF